MKKFFSFLMAAALLLGAGALTACGDDEENQTQNPGLSEAAAALVGTWRTETAYGYYCQYTLNADGTGVLRDVDLEYGDDEIEPFRWSYDATTRRLVLTYGSGYDSEREIYEVISVSQNSVILGFWDDGELYYEELYRIK